MSTDGQRLLDTDEKLQYVSSGMENIRIEALKENFNYSCTVQENKFSQEQVAYGELSDPCNFSTDYGGILCSSHHSDTDLIIIVIILFIFIFRS